MLRDQMKSVYAELRRLRSADGIDERLIELMQVLTRAVSYTHLDVYKRQGPWTRLSMIP